MDNDLFASLAGNGSQYVYVCVCVRVGGVVAMRRGSGREGGRDFLLAKLMHRPTVIYSSQWLH